MYTYREIKTSMVKCSHLGNLGQGDMESLCIIFCNFPIHVKSFQNSKREEN